MNPRIAVFHNYLDNIGGSEIVALTLARELEADLYTTNIDREKIRKMGFSDVEARSIGRVPVNAPFRQQMTSFRFRHLNLKKQYDHYIIAGDWAVSGAVNNKPNMWYVHSPIREIWDLYEYTRTNNVPLFARPVYDLWVRYNRRLNRKYVKHVGKLCCNSDNTRDRTRKYLGRDAEVIYPPVDTTRFHYEKNGDYWLSVNRLITHKRVDIQIEAFSKLPDERLVIVGSYEQSRHFREYADRIQGTKPANVEIASWSDSSALSNLFANCRGFITTSKDEDFGMTAVEAMASGKPVIAPDEGGYRETVVDGVTGRLIDGIDASKLAKAIKEVGERPESYRAACLRRAKEYDKERFMERIRDMIA